MQADRGDGSISIKGDQRRDHKLTALLGQEPRSSQRHWGYCQKTGRSQSPGRREHSGIWRLSSLVGGDQVHHVPGMAKVRESSPGLWVAWAIGT